MADTAILKAMANVMHHRGPDGEGFFVDGPVGLAHRRLSIIDLATGDQPMSNEDGSLVIVYNGEIYNYQELRELTERGGHSYRSQSDTETILHLYEEFGTDCVKHLNGIFAFAIWDKQQCCLFLARDRLGVKPLYYWSDGRVFLFASEIKAFLAYPGFQAELNPTAAREYLTYVWTLDEHTFFRGVKRLPPAHWLSWQDGQIRIHRYWDVSFEPKFQGSEKQALDELEAVLEDSVRLELVSDVPLGSFLSGGLDTSTIVAMAMRHTAPGFKTFSVGFREGTEFDELPYAQIVADQYGTVHNQIVPSAQEFLDFFPRAIYYLDEPAVGPPAVSVYFVCRLAKSQGVTVLLSGEGGDEIFAGYPRALALYQQQLLSGTGAGGIGARWQALRALSRAYLARTLGWRAGLELFRGLNQPPARRYHRMLRAHQEEALAALLTPEFAPVTDHKADEALAQVFDQVTAPSDLDKAFYVDLKTYLVGLLHVADRMSMAASVEARVPLLDHRLVEWAARLPPALKTVRFETKGLFRRAAVRWLPPEIVRRPKVGFQTPFQVWVRQPDWREFVYDTLLSPRALQRGYLNPGYVRQAVHDLYEGNGHTVPLVWQLLNLELWHRTFIDSRKTRQ